MAIPLVCRSETRAMSTIDFEAVKRRAPLPQYCQAHGIEFRRARNNLLGLCPLHDESTPSFTVFPDGHFHCYGCGAHGDIVDLDRALYGGSAREAAQRLAGQDSIVAQTLPRAKKVTLPSAYELTEEDRALINAACDRL